MAGDRFQSGRPTGAGADSAAAVSAPATRTARCFPGSPMAREIGLRPPAGFPQRFADRPGRVGDLAAAEPLQQPYSAMFSGGPNPGVPFIFLISQSGPMFKRATQLQ